MFDIDLSSAKFLKGLAGFALYLGLIILDIVLIYLGWSAIFHHLGGVALGIAILAVIGAIIVTGIGILVTFWLAMWLIIRIQGGMSSIH